MRKEPQTVGKAKQKENAGANESPFKEGECLCGIPNCKGHEVIDGKLTIKDHPVYGTTVVRVE
jgi:hypothetical protein